MKEAKGRRRRHDSELKKAVLAECAEPGASVASVAFGHGLNANLVHKWRRLGYRGTSSAADDVPATQFVRVALPQPALPSENIRIELRRGPIAVCVTWPLPVAAECASWIRELLR